MKRKFHVSFSGEEAVAIPLSYPTQPTEIPETADLCERVSKATGKPPVTTATMCVELQRLKLPLKKSRFMRRSEKVNECKSDA